MIIFLDTETTGKPVRGADHTHPGQPHMVQLAAVLCEDDGKIVEQFELLVKPNGWSVEPGALAVHGISDLMLESHGIALPGVLKLFRMLCDSATRAVAHNMAFDKLILQAAFLRSKLECPLDDLFCFCTMEAATPICKLPGGYRGYKWPSLAEAHRHFVGNDFDGAHSALADTHACMRVYFALQGRGGENADANT